MAVNRGKQFEEIIKQSFEKVPETSVVRLHDQTTGYLGSKNHCDFIVYHKPLEYHLECKSVHGNTLPLTNITDNQWQGLLEKSKIKGVVAGIICWWIDKNVTLFLPIEELELEKQHGWKSVRYDIEQSNGVIEIFGKKKRVFFDYDMEQFIKEVEYGYRCNTRKS